MDSKDQKDRDNPQFHSTFSKSSRVTLSSLIFHLTCAQYPRTWWLQIKQPLSRNLIAFRSPCSQSGRDCIWMTALTGHYWLVGFGSKKDYFPKIMKKKYFSNNYPWNLNQHDPNAAIVGEKVSVVFCLLTKIGPGSNLIFYLFSIFMYFFSPHQTKKINIWK